MFLINIKQQQKNNLYAYFQAVKRKKHANRLRIKRDNKSRNRNWREDKKKITSSNIRKEKSIGKKRKKERISDNEH